MKTQSTKAAFFNLRILTGFALFSVGLFLGLAGLSKSVTGTVAATVPANPIPLINQPLVPDATAPGGAGFTLTVNGTGFVSTSAVKWNGTARSTTFVSSSQLTASILSSDVATGKTASVTVVNPAPGGGTSNAVFFEVTVQTPSIALAKSDFSAGSSPQAVATGDFNRDGKLDLAETNYDSDTVRVLLGNGHGTFGPPTDYVTGSHPIGVVLGDFNGDGKLDLAVTNGTDNTVSILLGNGDGTFGPKVDYATGVGPGNLALADLNGDGKLDLAVSCNDDVSVYVVSVLLGNGDGTFKTHADYTTGSWPSWVAVTDFNGDGRLDMVTANAHSDSVSVLLGKGDGTFQPKVDYATGSNPRSVAVGDLNGDGKLDLAVASQFSNAASILLGNGDGTFQRFVDYAAGTSPVWLVLADFNGDGSLDLALASFDDSTLNVLLNNGNGTFQPKIDYLPGGNPTSVAIGDFNRDGRLDLAVTNSSDNTVAILLQATTVSLSTTSLDFGIQVIGTSSAPQVVTLTNTGIFSLTISSIAVSGADSADYGQTNTCGSDLPPGASCTISVTFAPTQTGPRTASLTITDNGAGSPQLVSLSGTGVTSGPNATLSTTDLTFTTQLVGTSSPPQAVTLSNYGSVTLRINRIAITGTDHGDFAQTNTCGSSVAPGASCAISATFNPTQSGTRSGAVSIKDNAPGSPQTVNLTGTGTVVELNPTSLDFGSVNVGSSRVLTTALTNVGSAFLSITSIIVTGSSEFSQTNTCGSGVGGGQSCTITVTFSPTVAGSVTGNVSISDNGGASPQTVPLSGSGVFPPCVPATCPCTSPCVCFFGFCRRFYSILDPKWNELFGSLVGRDQPAFASCGN
jgi:FG-GAP-like repeat/Abnormal spindle-like microcephaly-assoc'd, ASPM-SPD-2-Hydin